MELAQQKAGGKRKQPAYNDVDRWNKRQARLLKVQKDNIHFNYVLHRYFNY